MMNVNWLAVLCGGIVAMILGYIWFGPLFAKAWMKEAKLTMKDIESKKDQMPMTYGMMFVSALLMSYVLSMFVRLAGVSDVVTGMTVGFWAWLGFVAYAKVQDVLFEQKSWKLFAINAGYNLVLLVLVGAIVAVWR